MWTDQSSRVRTRVDYKYNPALININTYVPVFDYLFFSGPTNLSANPPEKPNWCGIIMRCDQQISLRGFYFANSMAG